jgi:hypothetical protein
MHSINIFRMISHNKQRLVPNLLVFVMETLFYVTYDLWLSYGLDDPPFVSRQSWKEGFSLLQNVQTGSGAHPASYSTGIGLRSRRFWGWGVKVIRAAESGFGPGEKKISSGPPVRADRQMEKATMYTAQYERWPLAASAVNTTNHNLITSDTTETDKNICNIAGPPSGLPGSGKVYRLPPPLSTALKVIITSF